MKRKKKSLEDIILDFIIYLTLIALTIMCIYPVWYVIVASFSDGTYIAKQGAMLLWPEKISLEAYQMVFRNAKLMTGFRNTLTILALGLPINIILTVLCGHFMSDNVHALWKKPIISLVLFTMFFSGGMIPSYLNIKDLGLYNSTWSLILPGALSVYNAIICKTAIEGIPKSLYDAAYIDGASEFVAIRKITLPLIKPTLAVLLLYYGVAHWNAWFHASIYIKDDSKRPVQNILHTILVEINKLSESSDTYNAYAETVQYAAIVIISLPIFIVYPFLQKHFAKGVMIGAVKG